MGVISGNKERAAEVKKIMQSYVEKTTNVTDKVAESDKPKVFWMWTDVYGTAGVKSGMNDLIEEAGGVNVMNARRERCPRDGASQWSARRL